MAKEVRLPQLGQTMEEGTIVNCLVKVGERVKKGDVLFEIETDKATLELESPADGFVRHIIAEVGRTLPVGEPVLVLGEKDEQITDEFIKSLTAGAPAASAEAAQIPAPAADTRTEPTAAPAAARAKTPASPRAKKLAAELGVDLTAVKGTGPGGRITEDDVSRAGGTANGSAGAAPTGAEPRLGQTIPLSRLQKITGRKMLRSKQEIPCFYLNAKADVTELVTYRTKLNQTGDVKVAYNDFIIKAVATGLEKFPLMTGQLDGDNIKLAGSIGVGLAISVADGLVAPIVKDVQNKTLAEVARYSISLIERTRAGKLTPDDLAGGCITVSNLGAFGIDSFIPIVVPGQCSILGIGQITDALVPSDGGVLVRKLFNMTLSADHKVTNGAYAAEFLDFVRKTLEEPGGFK